MKQIVKVGFDSITLEGVRAQLRSSEEMRKAKEFFDKPSERQAMVDRVHDAIALTEAMRQARQIDADLLARKISS